MIVIPLIVLYDIHRTVRFDLLFSVRTIRAIITISYCTIYYPTVRCMENSINCPARQLFSLTLSSLHSHLVFLTFYTFLISLYTMSSSSKRGHFATISSSSSSRHSARFLNAENEEAYHKYKACKITPSKMLNQATLNFEVLNLFASTIFQFLLTLAFPYNSELLLEFLANLTYTVDNTTFHSFVCRQKIEITRADIAQYIGLSTEGPRVYSFLTNDFEWSDVNQVLRNVAFYQHQPLVQLLNRNAIIIQHVRKTSIIHKLAIGST